MFDRLRQLFAKTSSKEQDYLPFEVRAANALRAHLAVAVSNGGLHDSEVAAISRAENALLNGAIVTLGWPSEVESALESFWDKDISFRQFLEAQAAAYQKAHDSGIRFSLMEPRWSLMLSDDFIRSITKIDKKLQGRVLQALTRITESPMTAMGDTIKPLSGDLKGLWRYRIGDYRLLYDPSVSEHHITLLSFEARGDVY